MNTKDWYLSGIGGKVYKDNWTGLYMHPVQNTPIETSDKCFLFETEDTRMESVTHSWKRKVASTGF